jgi:hypothetical protein
LIAACRAYVDFARSRPERYRAMFGGAHDPGGGGFAVAAVLESHRPVRNGRGKIIA